MNIEPKTLICKALLILAALSASYSCSYDDTLVWEELEKHDERIKALEELCRKINTNIESLQTITSALQNSDHLVSVTPVKENGEVTGYVLLFSKSGEVTIWHGTDGKDGADGKDGHTPAIGVKADADGQYYWTLDGEWLTDASGNKIKASAADGNDGQNGSNGTDGRDGITPQLKIEDEEWYVSYDEGGSWTKLGKATGDSMFSDVTYDEKGVYLVMADGTQITIPLAAKFALELGTYEITCEQGETVAVAYALAGNDGTAKVTAVCEGGYSTEIQEIDTNSGKIVITAAEDAKDGRAVVLASCASQTVMQVIEIAAVPASERKNLSPGGQTANSYIISEAGKYRFAAVKGNGSEALEGIAATEVVWESFGTSEIPEAGVLIAETAFSNGEITFATADTFAEGNALIAAKDAEGTTLWSWHIWLTDKPVEQELASGTGSMMDRNLGATSAEPGAVESLGLLYQWGRKDPFLGSSAIGSTAEAGSTLTWPAAVVTDETIGTLEYTIANPTTFVRGKTGTGNDWLFAARDNTLWQSDKTVNDPCPAGWRVPDGGPEGIWVLGGFPDGSGANTFDKTTYGMTFSLSENTGAWYPAPGYKSYTRGTLTATGTSGMYWSVTPYGEKGKSYALLVYDTGLVGTEKYYTRAQANSVRCAKE